jgi:hypothetical protein
MSSFAAQGMIGADSNTIPDSEIIPSQLSRSDKIDINNAGIAEYKKLSGFFPHAAAQIASHGPYKGIKDIYNIPTANNADNALFKKFEKELVVLPPGRNFEERLSGRQNM